MILNQHNIGGVHILNGKGGLTGCGLHGQSNIAGCFRIKHFCSCSSVWFVYVYHS